jgi:hypothetical protein
LTLRDYFYLESALQFGRHGGPRVPGYLKLPNQSDVRLLLHLRFSTGIQMLQLVIIQQDLPMQLHATLWPHIQLVKGLVLYLHEIEGLPEVLWLGPTQSLRVLPLLEVEQALFLDLIYELLGERTLADHIPEVQLKVLLELLWDNLDYPTVLPFTACLILHAFLILLVCGASSATGSVSVGGGKASSMRLVPTKPTSSIVRGEMMLG